MNSAANQTQSRRRYRSGPNSLWLVLVFIVKVSAGQQECGGGGALTAASALTESGETWKPYIHTFCRQSDNTNQLLLLRETNVSSHFTDVLSWLGPWGGGWLHVSLSGQGPPVSWVKACSEDHSCTPLPGLALGHGPVSPFLSKDLLLCFRFIGVL